MNILIVNNTRIPVVHYGGTERVIWYLGKELARMGHNVSYLVAAGSRCHFARVLFIDSGKKITDQIPEYVDIVHFNSPPDGPVKVPYLITMHGNRNDLQELDINTVFVSANHASRFGSNSFVYNGIDWNDYEKPLLQQPGNYFHFLGNAAWRLKNVKGAIQVIRQIPSAKLKVMGGNRLNFRMGFRLTIHPRISFYGNVGGEKKTGLLQHSRGFLFPVKWHEPFGLAIIESLFYGCPVFGTPYGSLPELVTKEVGFLSDSSEVLATAMQQFGDYNRRYCHQYVADNFNSFRMAAAYLKKYETILNGLPLNTARPRLLQVQAEKFLPWN
ncbi:MAG: glycosyltransferase [Chitinophagaceae bacterium]|nr:glycosyltransferase [Chitinophagaceae bacterium]